VIEYLAIKATGDDPFGTVDFSTTVAGVSAIYQLLPVPLVNRISAIDKQVRIFADNSEIDFIATRLTAGPKDATVRVTVSGHLVDLP
jgi:hypothetical protein